MNMVNISKSRYTSFVTCPKQFWLKCHQPELAKELNKSLEYRFEQGNEAGETAHGLFPDIVNATALKPDGKLDIGAMCETTKRLISENCTAIAEAAFSGDGFYCAVDILKNNGDGTWDIYEVKSSSLPDKPKDIKEIYYHDIAFQRHVLTECDVNVRKCHLALINTEYVRNGEIDPFGLFAIKDVTSLLSKFSKDISENLAQAQAVHASATEPPIDLNKNCKKPYICPFYEHCTRHLPKPSVFDLYGIGFTNKEKLKCYHQGIISFEDIRRANVSLKVKQQRQLDFTLDNKEPYVDKAGIHNFLRTIKFPAYFLDFETYMGVLPLYDGQRPFQQIPFQYSLHILQNENDKQFEHKEFLADENKSEWRTLAERLVADVPRDGGSVISYNASFEVSRIKEIANAFPDLAERLLDFNVRMVDLLDVFRGEYMYTKEMGGSFSIKNVLPALCPNNPDLDYKANEDVQDGMQAMMEFLNLKNRTQAERERIRQNLLKYCRLDTLAMVEIYKVLLWRSMDKK